MLRFILIPLTVAAAVSAPLPFQERPATDARRLASYASLSGATSFVDLESERNRLNVTLQFGDERQSVPVSLSALGDSILTSAEFVTWENEEFRGALLAFVAENSQRREYRFTYLNVEAETTRTISAPLFYSSLRDDPFDILAVRAGSGNTAEITFRRGSLVGRAKSHSIEELVFLDTCPEPWPQLPLGTSSRLIDVTGAASVKFGTVR